MANNEALSDDQILSIIQQEISSAAGNDTGELSNERAAALDYYLGEAYGDEVDGRSSVVTREVLETVEWILPSLMRIFTDTDNAVVFEPTGPEDVQQARLETDAVNHVFWKNQRGFFNVYSFCKDALLSKTGILKIAYDEQSATEREEYRNLTDIQLGQLLNDPEAERQVLEVEENEDGYHVVFETKREDGQITITPIPPEEFGISSEANTPYVEDAQFAYHRARKSYSDLIAMGFEPEFIRSLPDDDDIDDAESLARRNLSDEDSFNNGTGAEELRYYWITEAYLRIDRDGTGAQLLQVMLAGGNDATSGSRLMSIEPVDRMPFATVAPILLTHKFFGLSIADLTMDLQRIKSTLLRSVLDNTYLANNQRMAVNDRMVNLDDLVTSRPGGVVRFKGDQPAANYITPIPHNPLPQSSYGIMEYLDDVRKQRTGVGDEVAGLDGNSLASVNPSVAALSFDAARMKVELIARIIAEIGLKTAYSLIHELLMKHKSGEFVFMRNGQWAAVSPSEWRTRKNSTVQVGVGNASRERRLMALEAVMSKQMEQAANGGMGQVLNPMNLYQTLSDWTHAWGLEPAAYWTDPRMQPPPQPQPDVQAEAMMMQARALMTDAESKIQRNQIEMEKVKLENAIRVAETDLKAREQKLKLDIELMKAELAAMAQKNDGEEKIASLELQMDKADTETRLKELQMQLDTESRNSQQEIDIYKAQLAAMTKLTSEGMKIENQDALANMQSMSTLLAEENNQLKTEIEALNGERNQTDSGA